jgi:uncharacterized pyridoxamine 5'-phosphate oxidase family protein
MHETPADIDRLQQTLDASYQTAGQHFLSIVDLKHCLSASQLAETLKGVCVLNLATVTAKGEPRVAPVDGLFYRGQFWFGSSPDSIRFRHIRHRPAVSGSYVQGEALAVIVHGRAHLVDLADPDNAGVRAYYPEVYGAIWEDWSVGATYARIDADRLYAFGGLGDTDAG